MEGIPLLVGHVIDDRVVAVVSRAWLVFRRAG